MTTKSLSSFGIMLLCGVAILWLAGCGNSQSNNPVSPTQEINAGQVRAETSRQLSEDTRGSTIDTSSYPEGMVVIVAVGDSITLGEGSRTGGYPTMLQRKLNDAGYNVVVRNRGIGGERSYSTYQRWLKEIATADITLLMIGINDVVNPANCHEPYNCRTREYIEAMINQALISKKIPLVSAVTPAKNDDIRAWANPDIKELNAQISNVATRTNVTFVDNYRAIRDNGGDSLYSDHLHFNDAGYNVIAQNWYNAIVDGKLIEAAQ